MLLGSTPLCALVCLGKTECGEVCRARVDQTSEKWWCCLLNKYSRGTPFITSEVRHTCMHGRTSMHKRTSLCNAHVRNHVRTEQRMRTCVSVSMDWRGSRWTTARCDIGPSCCKTYMFSHVWYTHHTWQVADMLFDEIVTDEVQTLNLYSCCVVNCD